MNDESPHAAAAVQLRQAVQMQEGAGARVRRLMPVAGFMNYDPFVLWDHFEVASGAGFPPHPHRGFEAITYMFEGGFRHEDSLGNASTVTAGGAQRFTAGAGLVHSEMPASRDVNSGIQLWINLPHRLKSIAPDYQQVDAEGIPETRASGATVRTIVGAGSPVALHTPVEYLDVQLDADTPYTYPIPDTFRGLVYVAEGRVTMASQPIDQGHALFLDAVRLLELRSHTPSRLMLCIGRPHGESIRQHGPYVD